MSGVLFTDGFDRPDTIALGLDAPRLVTVVAGALCAYGIMQAPLPMALRVAAAVLVASVAAVLGWGRYAGRPLLSWTLLALRFALSPRSGGGVAEVATPAGAAEAAVPAPAETAIAVTVAETAAPAQAETAVTVTVGEAPVQARDKPSAAAPAAAPDPAPWMRWLEFDMEPAPQPAQTDEPPASECAAGPPANTLEITRDAPLVVVMDEPCVEEPESTADATADAATGVELPPDAAAGDAELLHLPLRRDETESPPPSLEPASTHTTPPPVFVGAPRRVTFFSLKGGPGRTTLATELACILAARGRHRSHDGTVRPLEVALLDLDLHSATVAVRLGVAHPTLADYLTRGAEPAHLAACMVRHRSGARVLLGPPKPVASGPGALEPARVAEIVHRLERDGVQFIVIDVGADLGAVTTWVLSAAHDVFLVVNPTASGVQDAYRSTEALRRLGLGQKLGYVVNRARGTPDLSEVMGDLGGRIAAVIPDDPAVEEAENDHRLVALESNGPAAHALHEFAAQLYPSLSTETRRPRMGWLPWRRQVG